MAQNLFCLHFLPMSPPRSLQMGLWPYWIKFPYSPPPFHNWNQHWHFLLLKNFSIQCRFWNKSHNLVYKIQHRQTMMYTLVFSAHYYISSFWDKSLSGESNLGNPSCSSGYSSVDGLKKKSYVCKPHHVTILADFAGVGLLSDNPELLGQCFWL